MNLVHKDGIILVLTENKVIVKTSTVFIGTKEECEAEIARLGLVKREVGKKSPTSEQQQLFQKALSAPPEVQEKIKELLS